MPGAMGKSLIQVPPRRYKVVFGLTLILFSIIYLLSAVSSPNTIPVPSSVREHLPDHIPRPAIPGSLPSLHDLNPFKSPTHKPPEQANSSSGDTRWYADWRWKNPFSSTITLDEERSVLPPLKVRPPVYTFYESSAKNPKAVKEAEQRLLLQWRKAWWAQGFRPIVLGREEALHNPLYKKVQMLQLEDNMEVELARWLAWGNMGSGILANWLTFPMASHGNPLLAFLRRGQYPQLTRYEGLRNGLFCGEKTAINQAVEKVIASPDLKKALSMADSVFESLKLFRVDHDHDGVAFYDSSTISNSYKKISEPLFGTQKAKGLDLLGDLVNAHLHTTWQSAFADIAVLKPLPKFMTTLIDPAYRIAANLSSCPSNSPMPTTCPPNRPKCKKCISSQPLTISFPLSFWNKTDKFYIGTVPHPYTTTALHHEREAVDASFVRRLGFKARDGWLTAITADNNKMGASNPARISEFKDSVAGDWAMPRTLWIPAEDGFDETELQWIFGFAIPHEGRDEREEAKSETPVPGPERRPKPQDDDEKKRPAKDQLQQELIRMAKAREVVRSKGAKEIKQREAIEAWNLGDTEAWRFVRAYAARKAMERLAWEKDEKKFAGAERKGSWRQWWD